MSEPSHNVNGVDTTPTPCRSILPVGTERDSLQATEREQ